MRNKARVAGVVAAAAAGLLMLGAPAFAATPMGGHGSISHNHEYNGINILNENNVQIPICAAGNNVAVLGAVVPILSPQTVDDCATAVIDQSSDD